VAHRVARALKIVVPTERVYIASLGSKQGNDHIHLHVAALPPGVPYERQQFHALMSETAGVLELSRPDQAVLAQRMREAVRDI
jgi:histidine triad (HIT) family protein